MRLGDRVIRVSTTAAVLVVAAVAALVSYKHAVAVVQEWGAESGLTARLIPLTLDGLVAASAMVMLWTSRYKLPVPPLARWALGLGIAATVATNALHGLSRGWLAAVIAAWPAVALVISYELVMWIVRSGRELAEAPAPNQSPIPPKLGTEADQTRTRVRLTDDKPQPVGVMDTPKPHLVGPVTLDAEDVSKIGPIRDTSNGHVKTVDTTPNGDIPDMGANGDMSESDRIAVVLSFLADDPSLSGPEIAKRFGRTDEAGKKWGYRLKTKALTSMNGKAD